MLSQVVLIDLAYQIFEAGDNGERRLVTSGEYQEAEE